MTTNPGNKSRACAKPARGGVHFPECPPVGRLGYTVAVPIVFDQEIHVHYGQFYVESRTDDVFEGLTESRGGQANGLCGAAVPGLLFLTTGLHTGHTRVTVEVLDAPAPIGDEWEDVVEASFRPATAKVALVQWAGQASWPLPLVPIDYRVRYSATGMDRAQGRDTLPAGEPLLDRYQLQFWSAPLAPDAVIREASRCAAYWHAHARTLPSPPTSLERADAKRREQEARERVRREAAKTAEARRWGGRLPDERVRRINGAQELARLDRELVDGIADLDPTTQRAVAVWAARRACAAAGLTDLDWVKPALAALERGESLPFTDLGEAFRLLDADPHVRRTSVAPYDGRLENLSQQHMAVPALWSAAADDPLGATLESLFHAMVTFGIDYRRLLSDVRDAFPELAERDPGGGRRRPW